MQTFRTAVQSAYRSAIRAAFRATFGTTIPTTVESTFRAALDKTIGTAYKPAQLSAIEPTESPAIVSA